MEDEVEKLAKERVNALSEAMNKAHEEKIKWETLIKAYWENVKIEVRPKTNWEKEIEKQIKAKRDA